MNKNSTYILDKIKSLARKIDSRAEIVLFGSRARGKEKPDSDWDILVLSSLPATLSNEQKFREAFFGIELDEEISISTFIFSLDEWKKGSSPSPLNDEIRREGFRV